MKFAYIAFAYLSLFTLGFIDNSRGPIYPEILNFFHIDNSTGALIFSLSALSSFIAAFTSKRWLSKFGALNSSRLSLLFYFVTCIIMGTVEAHKYGFLIFLLASLVFGLGVGIQSITLNLIINDSSPKNHRRRVFAGLHSMYGVASLIAPFLIGFLSLKNISWQTYFLGLSIVPAIFLIGFFTLKSQNIKKANIQKINISKKQQWIIALVFACYVCGEVVLSSRLVVYLTNAKEFSNELSANYLSVFFLLLLVGRLVFTIKHFHTKSDTLLKLSIATTIISVIGGILVWPPFLVLSGLTMSYFFPCAMDWLGDHFHTNMDAIFSKVMTIVGGSLVGIHWAFGFIASNLGLETAIWLVPTLHIVVLYILQFKTQFLAKPV